MALNKRIAAIGLAKQSAKGSLASAPTFWCGVTDGKLVTMDVSQKPDEVSTGMRAGSFVTRDSVALAGDFTIRAWPGIIGLLLYGIMGTKSVSGSSTYTHIFTLGDSVPYFTLWAQMFGGGYRQLGDAKIDELKIGWADAGPLDVNVTMAGLSVAYPSAPTPGTDETRAAYFVAAGGTRQIDLDGATLATIATSGGEVALKQNLSPAETDISVVAYDVDEGNFESNIQLKGIPADLSWARNITTGGPTGTTISEIPVTGSATVSFPCGSNSLTLAGTNIPFTADEDGYDAKGGRPTVKLTGDMLIPEAGTTPVTATLVNSVASY